jgi:aminoglycoside/choline kinase family phosphotransferase
MADGASRIWCAYTQERRENAAFAAVAECLRSIGVRTPAVIIHLPDAGEMLLEDLGGEDMLGMPRENLAAATEGLLGQIALLHARGAEAAEASNLPLQPPFNEALYQWEADYFRNELLANVLNAPRLWNEAVEAEWRRMMQTLLAEPLVTLHRDLQSANVKIRDGRTWLIDFQGIRLGAAAYDLASLLYDPYLERTPEERLNGWSAYCRAVTAAGKVPPADELFHAAAVQRLMQALGAYGKLWKKDGLEKFRTRITPALKNISAAVKCTSYRTLDAFFEEVARIWAAHPEYTDSGKFG